MNCPKCGAPADSPTANFCEECGASLHPPVESSSAPAADACEGCGAGPELVDAAGFCGRCGVERHVAKPRDHLETVVSPSFAGVSDRGHKHHRNEDFLALAGAGDVRVAAVCDGVSNSRDPDTASAAAAPAICETLLAGATAPDANPETLMHAALGRAQSLVKALTNGQPANDAPASTAVAAILQGRSVTVGWLGDSRAYYLNADASASRLLTKDHSWLNEVVDAGVLSLVEAKSRRGAHTVTRTLGGPPADPSKGDDEPTVERVELPGPGFLLLCSDGLWNYVEDPAALAAFLRPGDEADALALARRLVDHARERGGRDNITVIAATIV